MKKLHIIIICLAIALTATAQTIGDAFYIYRNDAQFNAFFRDEVQSIEYSNYDADGNYYDEIVTQIVNTPDSIYQIPLAAIDSVGFVQPEKEFQPDVMRMDETWLPYVIRITENSITFSPSTPVELLPQQGQVMVAETFEFPFETGFSGRVSQIKTYSDSIVCVVEEVLLSDIYKRLVTVGMSCSEGAEENTTRSQRRIWGMNTNPGVKFPLLPITDLTVGPVTISCTPTIILKYIVCLWENNLKDYVDIRCYQTYDGSVSINAKLEESFTPEPKWVGSGITVPTGVPGLYGRLQVGGFFRATGSVQLSATRKFYRNGVSGFVYSEDTGFKGINEWDNPPEEDWEASVSIDGSLSAGVAGRLQFGIVHEKLASADITLYVGPEISGHAELKATDLIVDKNLYSSIKDSEITLSIIADVVPGYQLAGFKSSNVMPEPPTHEETPVSLKFTWPLNHWYLVPEFDNLKWQADVNGGDLTGDIRRNLLPKVSLGWALYDADDNLYKSEYFPETYRKIEDWSHQGMTYHFDNLKKNTTFKAYPMVKLLGVEMRTDKSVDVCVMDCPVTLSDFKVTNKQHKENGFTHNGQSYDYSFNISITATLDNDAENIAEWGYVYLDPNGQETFIPLSGHSYTDTRYAYYRNGTPPFTCTLYGYVKYVGSDKPVYGESHDYPLEYDETSCPDANHPHWIDLGLPSGTKWACCNVGASTPEYYGDYFTFGQLWVPTVEQIQELLDNSTSVWTTVNGVNGRILTGNNGGSIFLPAAKRNNDGEYENYGDYWSSTTFDDSSSYPYSAYFLSFSSQYIGKGIATRNNLFSVRPVLYDNQSIKVTTEAATEIGISTATLWGRVETDTFGGMGIVGFIYSNQGDPRIYGGTTVTAEFHSDYSNDRFYATITDLMEESNYYYVAFYQTGRDHIYYGEVLSFATIKKQIKSYLTCPDDNHPHLIDLGLPSGTKWACCNVGATKPEEDGGYYAWGETSEKDIYNVDTYKWREGTKITKYCTRPEMVLQTIMEMMTIEQYSNPLMMLQL